MKDIEREAFEAWLLGSYGKVYSKEDCDRFVEHGHVCWLAWNARAAVEANRVPGQTKAKGVPCCLNYAAGSNCFADPKANCPMLASASPAQQKRAPMTDAQKAKLVESLRRQDGWDGDGWDTAVIEAAERHHGIRE